MDSEVLSHLGDPVTIDNESVVGVFQADWLEAGIGGEESSVNEPTLVVQDSVNASIGSMVDCLGKTYKVVRLEPDSTGLVRLLLRRV